MRPDTIIANGDKNTLNQLIMRKFQGVFVDSSITNLPSNSILNYSSGMTAIVLKRLSTVISFTIGGDCRAKILDLYAANKIESGRDIYCTNLVAIFFRNTSLIALPATTCLYSFGANTFVYVPRALIESYKTATNWSTLYASYPDMFRAVEDYTEDGTLEGDFDAEKLGIEI